MAAVNAEYEGPAAPATLEQKQYMLNYMERHILFSQREFAGPEGKVQYRRQWTNLSENLNNVPRGAHKTVDQWMKCWGDQKAMVKRRAGAIQAFLNRGTGGGCPMRFLSDYENRVLSVMGGAFRVQGFRNVIDPLEDDPLAFNPQPQENDRQQQQQQRPYQNRFNFQHQAQEFHEMLVQPRPQLQQRPQQAQQIQQQQQPLQAQQIQHQQQPLQAQQIQHQQQPLQAQQINRQLPQQALQAQQINRQQLQAQQINRQQQPLQAQQINRQLPQQAQQIHQKQPQQAQQIHQKQPQQIHQKQPQQAQQIHQKQPQQIHQKQPQQVHQSQQPRLRLEQLKMKFIPPVGPTAVIRSAVATPIHTATRTAVGTGVIPITQRTVSTNIQKASLKASQKASLKASPQSPVISRKLTYSIVPNRSPLSALNIQQVTGKRLSLENQSRFNAFPGRPSL